jgi:hypothetical protein
VFVFDIVGTFSLFHITPPLTARHRAAYRVAYASAVIATSLAVYGARFTLR